MLMQCCLLCGYQTGGEGRGGEGVGERRGGEGEGRGGERRGGEGRGGTLIYCPFAFLVQCPHPGCQFEAIHKVLNDHVLVSGTRVCG